MTGNNADYAGITLSGNLTEDINLFKNIFKKDAILRVKKISVTNSESFDCALI